MFPGILTKVYATAFRIRINRVEGIEVEQTILGRILGYGTIIVRGMGGSKEVFYRIENSIQFRRKVQEQIAGIQVPQSQGL